MPAPAPSGFDPNDFTPVVAVGVNLGVGSAGAGASTTPLTLVGNKIHANITAVVGSTTYTVTAGTANLEEEVDVPSLDDARTLFGAGSELFLMSAQVFAQKGAPTLKAVPVTESAGSRATATITYATTADEAGSVDVYVDGRKCSVSVASADVIATIAENTAHAINRNTDWPVTATFSAGVVTITRKQKGPQGNAGTLRAVIKNATQTIKLQGSTLAGEVFGTTVTLSAIAFSGGTTDDDVSNALAAIAGVRRRIACGRDDVANLTDVKTHVNTYSAIGFRRRQQAVVALRSTLSSAKSTSRTTLNASRVQIAWHYLSDQSLGEVAAAVAAARLYGDGQVGGGVGRARGEEAYPACNLDGCLLAGITPQVIDADRPLGTELKDAFDYGLTPLEPATANPGFCRIAASITSRSLDASSNPNYAVRDTSKVTVADYTGDQIEAKTAAEFANKNIAPDPTDGSGPTHPDVIFPGHIRSFWMKCLKEEEASGNLVNVDSLAGQLLVNQDPNNPSTVYGSIPLDVIDHFHRAAVAINQQG